ncbi:MAG: aminopeptidase P family protein, partial [Alphaproteobacteria bacterium]
FEILQIPDQKPECWIKEKMADKARLGFDPRLHTANFIKRLKKALADTPITLVPVDRNPVDVIWTDRPPPPLGPVWRHPIEFAGEDASHKIARLAGELQDAGTDAAVLTLPDSIAWLLNIRGSDLPHTPVALAFAILHAQGRPDLFIAQQKLVADVRPYLEELCNIHPPEALQDALTALGKAGRKVRLDPDTASFWFRSALKEAGAKVVDDTDPCQLPKAIKNTAEIAGARTAHRRDGAAVCRFLRWFDENAPGGTLDEITASQKLESFRAQTGELKEISFDTISAAGANGAIVHYRVTQSTNSRIEPDTLYLVDSGGQYVDGTTDITRTLCVGTPTQEMRRHFTLVLKGHIAIATARFPEKARGADLDPFARRALWHAGLDFDHGTGHGVGSYLSVHEGPVGISKRNTTQSLQPGMILSNEPGYYKSGAYGIRIENLVLVREPEEIDGGERRMMGFETLTLVPIDTRLVDPALLDPDERAWLNAYHERVRNEIGPALEGADRAWLERATAPIG